jgi:Ni,Fe-hydrogenase III small subunit
MSEFQVARQASVWVLPLETGGCGATLQSIYALLAPRYAAQLRGQGVSFARSPRHADIVLIAGPLSQAAREPVRRLLDSVPQPRVLISIGDCAIDGCVFAGSPTVTEHPAEVLDVHIEVGGCPPAPTAVLAAIVEAKRLLAEEEEEEVEEAGEGEEESEEVVDEEADADELEADAAEGADETEDDEAGDESAANIVDQDDKAESAGEDDDA